MSLRDRHKHPPDPGITDPPDPTTDDNHIYTLLADIDKYVNDAINPSATTNGACSQELYNECIRTWKAIQSFSLTELHVNYRHVEGYRDLIRGIQHAINSNTLTEAETDGFIWRLKHSFHEFERTVKNGRNSSPYHKSDSIPTQIDFFRNINTVDIQDSILTMNNHLMDPGVSNDLKHIKYILIVIQTTVLF